MSAFSVVVVVAMYKTPSPFFLFLICFLPSFFSPHLPSHLYILYLPDIILLSSLPSHSAKYHVTSTDFDP